MLYFFYRGGPPGYCKCNNGTYDDGTNTACGLCDYTWLFILRNI